VERVKKEKEERKKNKRKQRCFVFGKPTIEDVLVPQGQKESSGTRVVLI
jgi:hypothetical protein